jgi:hypothetical protein
MGGVRQSIFMRPSHNTRRITPPPPARGFSAFGMLRPSASRSTLNFFKMCVGAQWELPGAVGAQWELTQAAALRD